MSEYVHEAIVVTANSFGTFRHKRRHWVDVAYEKALEVFGKPMFDDDVDDDSAIPLAQVTHPSQGWLNNVRSFLVTPDGSKEGHEGDEAAERARAEYLDWLVAQSYGINEDGEYEGSPLDWIFVSFGSRREGGRIVADSTRVEEYLKKDES